jgi:hypothetical protein
MTKPAAVSLHPSRRFQLMEGADMHAAMPGDLNDGLVYRIRGEFLEMPGLRLTLEQAARLWHIDAAVCATVLMRLVAEHFLTRTRHGAFVRLDQA